MKIQKSHICLVLLLNIILLTVSGIVLQSTKPQFNIESPMDSAGEISIITPESRNYTSSMNGYYPAMYGFENELDGTSRTSIAYVDGTNAIQSNCEVEIINNYQRHNKVLRIHDGNTAGNAEAQHYFDSTQTTGTIEWWWLTPTISNNRMWIHLHENQIGTLAFSLGAIDNEFYQNNGTAVLTYNFNQWYHHEVSFDTISDTYDWYIDGIMVMNGGVFENPVSNVGSTNIKGAWSTTGESYFDAFGYDWDMNYTIGDNFDEGLLLSYENSTNLDWQGYSLDGAVNKTILGNTTIPMPSVGYHYIQVFGNNSIGIQYQSNIRHFSVYLLPYLNIITPENIIYTSPMSGYYSGTTSFEDIEDGLRPPNMDIVSSDPNCQVKVVSEKAGHKKVVHIDDDSEDRRAGFIYNFTDLNYGFFEYWICAEDASTWMEMQWWGRDAFVPFINIKIEYNKWKYQTTYDDFYGWKVIPEFTSVNDPQNNTWYHVAIHFRGSGAPIYQELNENQYKLNINGHSSGIINFLDTGASIDRFYVYTGEYNTSDFWFDAIGGNYDTNYALGDNLNEGLLVSYETNTNLDWIGYSLGGSPNITITGDKVIPLPENGVHSIILNGITSEGTLIQSEEIFFTIFAQDLPPPPPPPPQDYPQLIPIFLISIVGGIFAFLGIALLLIRRKSSSRTNSVVISSIQPTVHEYGDSAKENIKFCPFCGFHFDITHIYCANCGASRRDM